MTSDAADLARRAAAVLAKDDPSAPGTVERELAGTPPDTYFDPISLGALIVSVASLAWTIYHDKQGAKPTAQALERRLRVKIGIPDKATVEQRDRVIGVVVTEITREDNSSNT